MAEDSRTLRSDDRVQRRADLTLHLDATGRVEVVVDGVSTIVGLSALDLLRRLSAPARVGDLLADGMGGTGGAQAWMDASAALVLLHRAGAVARVGAAQEPRTTLSRAPFDSQFEHALMLHDVDRTTAFRQAIADVVRPGDVVVDIGAGTGVLALAAAQAGARRVFAVEAGAISDVAQAMFDGNGVSDRVEVLRGWSTEVELPERADVVVSETIGSEPLSERVLEIFRDARLRHARPGARFVPERLDVKASAFQLTPTWTQSFTPEAVDIWSVRYRTDFSPLLRWQGRQASSRVVPAEEVQGWQPLTHPVTMTSLDLTAVEDLTVDVQRRLTVTAGGRLDALVTHFDAQLSPRVLLSTDPSGRRPSSWLHPVRWVPPTPLAAGQRLELRYRYRAGKPHGLSLTTPD